MIEFIFMLTRDDQTLTDARDVYASIATTGVRQVGCQDVGLPREDLQGLISDIKANGHTSHLEVVSETEEGTLAGAHLDMASALRCAVKLAQIPLEDALRAAALTPARFLGLDNERGALIPGARADLVALTEDLDVIATWVDGVAEDAQGHAYSRSG